MAIWKCSRTLLPKSLSCALFAARTFNSIPAGLVLPFVEVYSVVEEVKSIGGRSDTGVLRSSNAFSQMSGRIGTLMLCTCIIKVPNRRRQFDNVPCGAVGRIHQFRSIVIMRRSATNLRLPNYNNKLFPQTLPDSLIIITLETYIVLGFTWSSK